jgi:hypothetical protein
VNVTFPEKLALLKLAEPVEVISPVETLPAMRFWILAVVMVATVVVRVLSTAFDAWIIEVTIEANVPVPVTTVLVKVPVFE